MTQVAKAELEEKLKAATESSTKAEEDLKSAQAAKEEAEAKLQAATEATSVSHYYNTRSARVYTNQQAVPR